jgi:hypothetical protein
MKAITYITLLASLILGLTSCEKDIYSIAGIDADAPIELRLNGSNYGWNNEKFTSDAGIYTSYNHPEIVMKDGGGFTFELDRSLVSDKGNEAELHIYINNSKTFKLNEVYSLVLLGDGMACIDIFERGATQTLPSGGTVTDIITHCYKATDGYLKITKMEPYAGDYLISGEFRFKGKCVTDGDVLEVTKGKFNNCRVCISYGSDCHGNEVE